MQRLHELRTVLEQYSRKEINLSEYPGFARAAVLVLLFPSADGFSTILTKRTDIVDTHKGQISFPGGMVDSNDVDIIWTALREAKEEIGIEPSTIKILSIIDDHPVPSQFVITPVVGYSQTKPNVRPHSLEVAEAFDVPLAFFQNEGNCWMEEREFHGVNRKVWFYSYEGRTIWGTTVAILRNLVSVISSSKF